MQNVNEMRICPKTACIENVELHSSPNQNPRPEGERGKIALLVIHGISLPPGEFGGNSVRDLFLNQLDFSAHPYYQEIEGLRVSSHLFIDRQGVVMQFVPFSERAWHAGPSSFGDRTECNDFSIGIELEGTDDLEYSPAQYASLIACTKAIRAAYPEILLENIVGHSDIAPGRKTDPGALFDWEHYRSNLGPV